MTEEKDKESKTEEASEKRLEDAFQEGNIFTSHDTIHFIVILLISIVIITFGPEIARRVFLDCAHHIYSTADIARDGLNSGSVMAIWGKIMNRFWSIIFVPLLIIFFSVFLGFWLQRGRILFSLDAFKFDIKRVSPLGGLKRIFSTTSIIDGIKSICKISIISYLLYLILKDAKSKIMMTVTLDVSASVSATYYYIKLILITISCFLFLVAIFDFFYQKFNYLANMRMSKEETKEEHKTHYGSPEIKKKQKAIHRSMKRRMMAAVPKATVVITNPTHIAVALHYDHDTMQTPVIVAMGTDFVAQEIKRIAIENFIPVIENRDLARSLIREGKIDSPIPASLYSVVAQIIIYVMKLKGKKVE